MIGSLGWEDNPVDPGQETTTTPGGQDEGFWGLKLSRDAVLSSWNGVRKLRGLGRRTSCEGYAHNLKSSTTVDSFLGISCSTLK